jgi:hypothetical protein
MTNPEEPAVPGRPEKAHGDALEEVVDASPTSESGQSDEAPTDQED